MPVRSKQLAHSAIPTGGVLTAVYTTPALETTILRSFSVTVLGVGGALVVVGVRKGAATVPLLQQTIPAGNVVGVERWTVLMAGDQLVASVAAPNTAQIIASGAELEGVAD